MARYYYRLADGQVLDYGQMPPAGEDAAYALSEDVDVPSSRTHRIHPDGTARAATPDEVLAWDATRPRYVDSRLMITRMTDAENFELTKLAHVDATVAKFINLFLCRAGRVDVNDPLSAQGWAYIKAIGVPLIWPDADTAERRVAVICA